MSGFISQPSCLSSLCDRDNFTVFRTLMLCVPPHFLRFNHTSNQGSTYFPKTKETSHSWRKQDDTNATSILRSRRRGVACGTHRCDLCCYLSRSAQCLWIDNAFLYARKEYSFPYYVKQMPELHITLYRICFLPYPFPLIIHYHPTIWHCLSYVV